MEVTSIPAGFLVISWSKKIGAVKEASFPENLKVSPDFITQIFSAHFQKDLNDYVPLLTLSVANRKVISYLTDNSGRKTCFVLLLHKEEKADEWIEGLKQLASILLEKNSTKDLSSLYKKCILKKG